MEDALCPVEGCQIPVDVVLRSSDQVLIGAHKANLDHYSDGFPSADATSDSKDPVDLTEDASTLKLLVQFMHKTRYPDVFKLTQGSLFDLANAAEKYVVHAAIGACSIYIRATFQRYPMKALAYAVEYNYPEIADIAAPVTMCQELSVMRTMLNSEGLFAWFQYKGTYLERINAILYHLQPSSRTWGLDLSKFECWTWYKNLGSSLNTLFQKDKDNCNARQCQCETALNEWKEELVGAIDSVPAFSTYLSSRTT